MEPLIVILICLMAAAFIGELFSRIGVPRVVGQISAGLLLGLPLIKPFLIDDPVTIDLLRHLADIGIILLLFFTGLEVSLPKLAKQLKLSTSISLVKTLFTLVLGYAVSHYLFGLSPAISFVVGVCLSVTATALALDLLEEYNMLKTKIGTLIIATGALDDFFELVLITIALSIISATAAQTAFMTLILNAILFIIALILFRTIIVPFILRTIEKQTEHTLLMSGMIITLLLASLSNLLGFGSIVGALVSGILLRQVLLKDHEHHRAWEAHHISKSVHTIAFGFLVPLFFVQIGLLTDLTAIWKNIIFGMVITIIAVIGTLAGCTLAHYLFTKQWKPGYVLGWALNSKGDTAFIIATLAFEAGAIGQPVFSSIIFMAIISTILSPIVFRILVTKRYV